MTTAAMRWAYDPATAQFISRDPMVMTTRSPYGYVGGNPLNRTDPSGLHVGDSCNGSGGAENFYGGGTTEAEDQSNCAAQGGSYGHQKGTATSWGGGGMPGMNPETNQSFDHGYQNPEEYQENGQTILSLCTSLAVTFALPELGVPRTIHRIIDIGDWGYEFWHLSNRAHW